MPSEPSSDEEETVLSVDDAFELVLAQNKRFVEIIKQLQDELSVLYQFISMEKPERLS